MTTTQIILHVLGGMGIFLYGIYLMGESLKGLAGSKIKVIIGKATNRVWKGILLGALLTAIIQSSSGMSAIVISLISAGMMNLYQAIPVIMGANIGTTITAILVGLDIKQFALAFVALGAIITFFIKNHKVHMIGLSILGFGLLFFGLEVMDLGLKQITKMEFFESLMQALDQPALGVLAGTILTGIIQSSSAVIAILQQIYATINENGQHAISLAASIAVILGSNIGTTVTSILSSLVASRSSKRAALSHVLFNVIGTIVFLIFLNPFTNFIVFLEAKLPYLQNKPENTLALVHIIFNTTTTFLLCWFVKPLVKISNWIIPLSESEKLIQGSENLEDALIINAPALALENAHNVIIDMCKIVNNMFEISVKYINTNDNKLPPMIANWESVVDTYDHKLHDYLVRLSQAGLDANLIKGQATCLDTIRDLERIGDHCVNIIEFMQERYDNNRTFDEKTLERLNHMAAIVDSMLKDAIKTFENNDKKAARRIRANESQVDELEKKYRQIELSRIVQGSSNSYMNYVDILSNFERIGDHANNIADNILFGSMHDIPRAENNLSE